MVHSNIHINKHRNKLFLLKKYICRIFSWIKCNSRNKYFPLSVLLLTSFNVSYTAQAAEADTYHGVKSNQLSPSVEGGFTLVAQIINEDRIENDLTASFDLFLTQPTDSGEWVIHTEGNTSPKIDGVSSVLGATNADSGSALDRDGRGQLQVSEFYYSTKLSHADLTMGLLDVTGFLDASDIANDETSQFLSTALVNNPTIEFPDYTLGVSYHHDTTFSDLSYTLVVTSSHGLADNPNVSYSELIDVRATDKGVFAAAEFTLPMSTFTLTSGFWVNTKNHQDIDGNENKNNSGIYLVLDGNIDNIKLNLRYGIADDSISEVDDFIGIAAEIPIAGSLLGIGYTITGLSKDVAAVSKESIEQFEIYYNFNVAGNFTITPIFQSFKNSGIDINSSIYDDINIISLRSNYTF